ncbi:DUF6300 family protein [Streptomyces sp. JB150]|uniref:DUF6300 family protein n=1 Tax=Streptomyces sp. JB150 TaxID=2714844 RepID=UPI0014074309|nr:DUF6300 family protein [Streptomyces sp. JB150]QIJ62540.1 hypothetical protein G7Z13_11195 [Streptomyces sp. JB150]
MRHEVHRVPSQPPCARCGADEVIVSGQMPVTDAFGQPVVIQLCRLCDADAAAGGPLVKFFREGGGHDPARMEEASELMLAWQEEAMAARGFRRMPMPGGGPSLN